MKNNQTHSELLKGKGLPEFNKITPDEINKYIPSLINDLKIEFTILEKFLEESLKENKQLAWDQLMTPIYEIGEKLRWSWGVINHLNAVRNSKELREAYSIQQPTVVRFSNKIGQSKALYNSLLRLKTSTSQKLEEAQLRIIDAELLSMETRGVGLNESEQKVFNERSERLAELSNIFSNNVLDSTNNWSLTLTEKSDVEGLPERALEALATKANLTGSGDNSNLATTLGGPWELSLDMPSYIAFITYAKNRSLREQIYKAHVSRASNGAQNNKPIIEEILKLRDQQAIQLGYKNWAEVSISSKMAKNAGEVEDLLNSLKNASLPMAKKELQTLKNIAKEHNAVESESLQPWDISFWSEVLRKKKFDLDQENLRPWFPLDQVLDGLFSLCERLFEIEIKGADGDAPIWHEDVRFFDVYSSNSKKIASFYLDPYSRPGSKRGGAWMDECLSRRVNADGIVVLPVAYLVCNQTPPTKDKPSLMSFEEVETLFHEFGHGLQHMLTTVNYPQAAGINNVEWDAVELPSQFMENWCLEEITISKIARHWKTGEALPKEDLLKLRNSRTYNTGLSTLRQVHFALTDLKLHSDWKSDQGITPDELRREIAKTSTVFEPIEEDQFLCAFSHIFAGGYSAGYYSYKWAEVLSADAFSAFEEAGLDNEKEIKAIGKKFRESILSLGGSLSPEKVFLTFRGRKPSTEALIRHSGLIPTP